MLVLSRERGNSIMVNGPEGICCLTLLEVRGGEVSLLISHSPADAAGDLRSWTAKLVIDTRVKVGSTAEVSVVDIREAKVRFGVEASKQTVVHHLEVYEAIRREQADAERVKRRAAGDDPDEGLAGSRVPRPGGPKPPSLDVRLDEPRKPDDK